MQVLLCLLSLSFIVLSFTFTLSFTCYPGATVPTAGEAGGPRIAVILLILNGALSQKRNMVSNIHFKYFPKASI